MEHTDTAALQQRLEDIFDQGLLFHGYVEYLRDDGLVVLCTAQTVRGGGVASLLRI